MMANKKRLADLVKEAMAEALKVYDADDYEELAEWIANWLELNWVTIQKNPTVDAVEVVHGRWIHGTTMHRDWMKCSECLHSQIPDGTFVYCPNCGAKMDGRE